MWVDTLAIAHSKVSWEKYRRSTNTLPGQSRNVARIDDATIIQDTIQDLLAKVALNEVRDSHFSSFYCPQTGQQDVERKMPASDDKPSSIYRTPEFCWSSVHLRLLNDLLDSTENVLNEWKSSVSHGVK